MYRGVHEVSQNRNRASPNELKTMDMLRFGKRVIFDGKLSNTDVLEDHLKQMHSHLSEHRKHKESRLKDEQETLKKLQRYIENEESTQKNAKNAMMYAFTKTNDE